MDVIEMENHFDPISADKLAAVSPVFAADKKKRRKTEAEGAMTWEQVLSATANMPIPPQRLITPKENAAKSTLDESAHELAAIPPASFEESARTIEEILDEIRSFADRPEELLESHLLVFTNPAPPGKVWNSAG